VSLPGNVHPLAQARFDRGPADRAMPIGYATLLLAPAPGLEDFLTRLQQPGPGFRRWLTPAQFGQRFGLSRNDLDKLRAWLESEGLQVEDEGRGGGWIAFSGTAGAAGRAFGTEIHRYLVNGEAHYANSTAPSIPAAFAAVVTAVRGLNDFRPRAQVRMAAPDYTSGGAHYLAPGDFATIYNLTPLYAAGWNGAGQSIAVAGQSGIGLRDIASFRAAYGLPANVPQVVLVGSDPGVNSDQIEADLDIEWSGAVARQASIVYVYASDVFVAAQYAVDRNLAPVLSLSYSACEYYETAAWRAVAQQAAAEGISWIAASGDAGAAECDARSTPIVQASKGPTGSFPATIPEITAVGGTELDDAGGSYWARSNSANGGSALSYIPEIAWNDSAARNGFSATGGAPSAYYAKPAWQTGAGVPADGARDVPDVALAASPVRYPYFIVSSGATELVGGTSVSTQAFAGMVALLNQYLVANGSLPQAGLGNLNPNLYRLAQSTSGVFHDVTAGNNYLPCLQGSPGCTALGLGYAAGAGYDLTTGLGSVDANQLVTQWSVGPAPAMTLTASPSTAAPTDTVQLTATVTGSGPAPTGSVTFVSNDAVLGTVALSSPGQIGLSVAGAALEAAAGLVTAVYSGDAVYGGAEASTQVALVIGATPGQSFVVPFVTPNPVPLDGFTWSYTVGLTELNGVATTLTGFTINGVSQNLSYWTSTQLPANGKIFASLDPSGLTVPLNRVFAFTGSDAGGHAWSHVLTVPFVSAQGANVSPGMLLSSSPAIVQQNPRAASGCQWEQTLTLQETGGFLVELNGFTEGVSNLSGQIQQYFGTTRLAPFGQLQADVCVAGISPPETQNVAVSGTSEVGTTVAASLNVSYAAAAAAPATFSVSPSAVTIPASGGPAAIGLSFSSGAPAWTASVLPANLTSTWLALSAMSGAGAGQIALTASATGLAPGVYNAVVDIQAANCLPQSIQVPVVLAVGAAPAAISIGGVGSNASGLTTLAPGMQAAVYGTGLALSTGSAASLPLPLTLAGVSATVNGVSAPLYFVSPNQIDLQIPYETGRGTAILAVDNAGLVAYFPVQVAVAAPGIFNVFYDASTQQYNAAAPGDAVEMFITGDGDVSPSLATGATPPAITAAENLPAPRQPVSLTVGGVAVTPLFVGIPSGLAGVTQINFTVPAGLAAGAQPVVVTVGGVASPAVNLKIVAATAP
jgi:uncharacterized protein (TIGR03437 family)